MEKIKELLEEINVTLKQICYLICSQTDKTKICKHIQLIKNSERMFISSSTINPLQNEKITTIKCDDCKETIIINKEIY